jgi:hypothetical protein
MRRVVVHAALLAICAASSAAAQEPPPRIGPFAVDLHLTVPTFPTEDRQLADSRGMQIAELPGVGAGIQAGVHLYLPKIKVLTVGVGAEFAASRARQTPPENQTTFPILRATEERFSTVSPQLSLNFGNGHGWSYLSAGIGVSNWALVLDGQESAPADTEALKTINYGGGARWFAKPHLAFSFDVRFYAINPGTPYFTTPLGPVGSPRTTLMIIGAGVSLK